VYGDFMLSGDDMTLLEMAPMTNEQDFTGIYGIS
jgi:hypothetical protein